MPATFARLAEEIITHEERLEMQNPQPMYGGPYEEKSSTGLESNIAALLAYVVSPLTGIIFYVIEKQSRFVRYHAMQSILFGVAAIIISIAFNFMVIVVSSFSWALGALFSLGGLLLALLFFAAWLYCLIKAYQGQRFKLPVIGDMAEQIASK